MSSSPFKLVNVEGEFEGRAKLQTHVFHHHVATQQQKGFPINFMFSKKVSMWGQNWVDIPDILHDFIYCPQVGILTAGPGALTETTRTWEQMRKYRFIRQLFTEWFINTY